MRRASAFRPILHAGNAYEVRVLRPKRCAVGPSRRQNDAVRHRKLELNSQLRCGDRKFRREVGDLRAHYEDEAELRRTDTARLLDAFEDFKDRDRRHDQPSDVANRVLEVSGIRPPPSQTRSSRTNRRRSQVAVGRALRRAVNSGRRAYAALRYRRRSVPAGVPRPRRGCEKNRRRLAPPGGTRTAPRTLRQRLRTPPGARCRGGPTGAAERRRGEVTEQRHAWRGGRRGC